MVVVVDDISCRSSSEKSCTNTKKRPNEEKSYYKLTPFLKVLDDVKVGGYRCSCSSILIGLMFLGSDIVEIPLYF